jgi:hypothetical protein
MSRMTLGASCLRPGSAAFGGESRTSQTSTATSNAITATAGSVINNQGKKSWSGRRGVRASDAISLVTGRISVQVLVRELRRLAPPPLRGVGYVRPARPAATGASEPLGP